MTGAVITAGTLLSTRELRAPQYPQTEAFSLQGLLGRLSLPKLRVVLRPDAVPVIPAWVDAVLPRFAELLMLRPDWDSYGGRPLTNENFEAALNVLGHVMGPDTPAPWIVPLPSGGVQLEWHDGALEIEVIVDRENSTVVVTEGDSDWEAPLVQALPFVEAKLRQLEPAVPAVAA